ncbi:DNA mismatch repair protein PMS1 [Golovinomyces cichoracearum]|uniref:DNA mismatch repair protein PMS1 n=1 Tax=Golovinomyces cichoracearum TaxID=62708 RepID=A0A420I2P0_9PEZI|nr:DNA mismatch repair protein PMS1 [Golovinomyces cichoracearum]
MPIKPLPETTVRLLSSSQALTTPTSLVKELIDNSLDAGATIIEVIISPNTLDRIEVRDNGHGIPLDDFDALGKRGYTSKLRSFEELKSIGGISLGFRGEALFSAVQLGKVSVTSKSEGEHVATQAQLKPLGGVDTQVSTSLPVGTTVCVTEFLCSIPVRKQTCLKEAPKTLGKLKELLRAYSLARPHIKFSLKLTKGGKFSWNYSPPRNNSIREAVSQIISRELASQCMEKYIVFEEETLLSKLNNKELAANKESSSDKNQFDIKIFVPKPTADFSKVSHGQYISIDGRPVSHDKGTMKKIVTIFKHHMRNCLPDTKKLCNPFLYMSMKLPVESYDPNVEPAKDDVLFINENFVLENIEKAFKDIYNVHEVSVKDICTTPEVVLNKNGLLLTPKLPSLTSSGKTRLLSERSRKYSGQTPNFLEEESNSKSSHLGLEDEANENHVFQLVEKANESIVVTKDVETPTSSIAQSKNITCTPDSSEQNHYINKVNPWLIAKQSLPKFEPKASFESSPIENKEFRGVLPTPQPSSDPALAEFEMCDLIEAKVKSPKKRKIIHRYENGGSISNDLSKYIPNVQDNLTGNYKPITDNFSEESLFIPDNTTACPTRHHEFVSARQLIDSQTSPRIPFKSFSSEQQNIIKKPFKSHINKNKEGMQGKLHQTLLISRNYEKNQNSETDSELEWNMDYEYRKEEANKKSRDSMVRSTRSSPHTNRYKAAALALDVNSCLDQPVAKNLVTYPKVSTTLPDDDPRGYYIRRQKSLLARAGKADGPKISKAKSLRLPLEHIPANQELHHQLTKIPLGMEQVKRLNRLFIKSDEYIQRGNQAISLAQILNNPDEKEKKDLIRLVKYLVGKKWNDDNLLPFNINEIEFKFNHFIVDES